MKKLMILLTVFGLFFGIRLNPMAYALPKIDPFSELPPAVMMEMSSKMAHAAEQAAMANYAVDEKELARVKKLAEEKIAEARQKRIHERASLIVEKLGTSGKTYFTDEKTGFGIERTTQSFEGSNSVEIKIYYLSEKIFHSVKDDKGLTIKIYRFGLLGERLERFFERAEGIERVKEIQDLKSRYGIK